METVKIDNSFLEQYNSIREKLKQIISLPHSHVYGCVYENQEGITIDQDSIELYSWETEYRYGEYTDYTGYFTLPFEIFNLSLDEISQHFKEKYEDIEKTKSLRIEKERLEMEEKTRKKELEEFERLKAKFENKL